MENTFLIIKPGEDLGEVYKVRAEIFENAEGASTDDDLDEVAINIVLKEDGQSIACGRLILDLEDDRLIIEQIGVIEARRRQGLGSAVVHKLIDIAKECDSKDIWAKTHNNIAAISLLEKVGFEELNPYWMNMDL